MPATYDPNQIIAPMPDSVAAIRCATNFLHHRAGIDAHDVWPDSSVVELCASHVRDERPMSPLDMARMCAESAGYTPDQLANPYELVRSAVSLASFSDVWTAVIGAQVEVGFKSEVNTALDWCVIGEVPNYKPSPRTSIGVGGTLVEVPRGQQAPHSKLGEDSELAQTQRVKRYGKQMKIEEMDLIDDNVGWVSGMAEAFGREAVRTIPALAYGVLLANADMADGEALFSAAHNNTATDALSIGAISTGYATMASQRVDGQPLHLIPDTLIVGADLAHSAAVIAGEFNEANQNPKLRVVIEPRLSEGFTDPSTGISYAGSATTWFLACARKRTVEIAGLNGRITPRVRQFVLDQGQWGLGFDVDLSVGACALGYQSLYRGNV